MIKETAANLASSLRLPNDLMYKEEHISAVRVGSRLAERNVTRPHLEDLIDWSQLNDGAKMTKAGDFRVYS